MANSHPLALAITAGLTKSIVLAFALFFTIPGFVFAQNTGDPLSANERRKFNEGFFLAQKEKNLGNTEKALHYFLELYRLNPTNATVCFELAQLYGNENRGAEAIMYAEEAVAIDPTNKWFQMLLASVYGNFGEPEKKMTTLENLVALEPKNPDYKFELAKSYFLNDFPDKALDELDELEELIGINEEITNQKKNIYLQQNNLKGAVAEIEKLIAAYPSNLDFYGTLAQLYMVNGEEKKSLEVYDQMIALDSADPRPHLDLAQYYQEQGNYEKSMAHLKVAMQSPNLDINKKVAVLLTLFQASAQDTVLKAEAFVMLETVIEQNPNDPKAYSLYGDFLSRDKKDAEALKMYKKAVSLEGGSLYEIWHQILLIEIQSRMYDSLVVDGPEAVDLFPNQPFPYFFTGIGFSLKGELQEAAAYLETGVNYVIGNPGLKQQFYSQLADIYHRMEEHKKSDSYFDKALALNPNDAMMLNNYAYYLSVRGEELEKALKMTIKSNSIEQNNATFMDTWAWVLYQKGDYEEALSKIKEVMELGGDKFGEVVEHYGDILYKNGFAEEAVEQWKKAKALGETTDMIDQKISQGKIVE